MRTVFTGFSRVSRGSLAAFSITNPSAAMTTFRTAAAWFQSPTPSSPRRRTPASIFAGYVRRPSRHPQRPPLRVPCGDDDVVANVSSRSPPRRSTPRWPFVSFSTTVTFGGVGIASRAAKIYSELVRDAIDIVSSRMRTDGCPSMRAEKIVRRVQRARVMDVLAMLRARARARRFDPETPRE